MNHVCFGGCIYPSPSTFESMKCSFFRFDEICVLVPWRVEGVVILAHLYPCLVTLGAPSTKANIQPGRGSATTSVGKRVWITGPLVKPLVRINDRMPTMAQHLRSSEMGEDQRIGRTSERGCVGSTCLFKCLFYLGPCPNTGKPLESEG